MYQVIVEDADNEPVTPLPVCSIDWTIICLYIVWISAIWYLLSPPIPPPPLTLQQRADVYAGGRWVYNASLTAPYINDMEQYRCADGDRLRYQWQPGRPFDGRAFLAALNNRSMLFVGDSMIGQGYVSLLHLLHGPRLRYTMENYVHAVDPDVKIEYIRDDYLYLPSVPHVNVPLPKSLRQYPWEHRIGDILILNRGAHYQSDQVVVSDLTNLFDHLWKTYPNITIIYQSSTPGHTDQSPVAYRPDEFDYRIVHKSKHPDWHWEEIYEQNAVVRRVFLESYARSPHGATQKAVFMNITAGSSLRKDDHSDNIHYCLPGSIDQLWNGMLFNIVLDMYKGEHHSS